MNPTEPKVAGGAGAERGFTFGSSAWGPSLVAVLGLVVVGAVDWLTGREIAISVFYLVPIVVLTWWVGPGAGYVLSLLCAGTWLSVEYIQDVPYSHGWIYFWNAGVRLVFFVVVAWQLGRIRYLTRTLEDRVRARTSQLADEIERRQKLETEVAEVSQREQTRLAHELHDRLGAHLAGVAFRSKAMAENLERRGDRDASEAAQVVELVNRAMAEIRAMARWLSPSEDALGLRAGLSRLGAEFETLFGITCLVEIPKEMPELGAEQVRQLYRIAQETIRNAVQHGRAQCVEMQLDLDADMLVLRIANDGEPWKSPSASGEGMGLRIMEYRARMLGGHLRIGPRKDGGCVVECRVPLRAGTSSGGGPPKPVPTTTAGGAIGSSPGPKTRFPG